MAKSADAFRTIGEVSEALDTPAHVLRFWESKFSQVRPVKRAGGRRYYRPDDMALLAGIKVLLHDQGMTIKGAQKILRDQGVRHVISLGESDDPAMADGEVIDHVPTPADGRAAQTARPDRDVPAPATAEVIPLPFTRVPRPRPAVLTALMSVPPQRMHEHRSALRDVASRLRSVQERLAPAIRSER